MNNKDLISDFLEKEVFFISDSFALFLDDMSTGEFNPDINTLFSVKWVCTGLEVKNKKTFLLCKKKDYYEGKIQYGRETKFLAFLVGLTKEEALKKAIKQQKELIDEKWTKLDIWQRFVLKD